ncbi:MAG: orotate phosphoribosyltransferase [Flavobacteriales bacterium]|nr:orotate phosphoribosyltransferase [Flavobacteriales bacterium]MBK9286228.1 orotate phosphoribosyltransferase [Flavobacteriales bacterium]MBL0034598.1 orotate phosphoribosyltransferase [Flavobacteriales bacterium]MCC7501648.1 orotate phosphoribosyltransferase [Flavobacteriales bacterium]
MDARLDPALKIAEFLLQIKAVKLSPAKPFSWASGWKSPIYCDNRKTLSYPAVRTYIRQQFVHVINHEFGRPDMVAGVATGGIAHGALVAHDLGLPFIYVRSSAKEHGMKNQVEGDLTVGRSVVVVEDLVSTGASSLNAVQSLRDAGCEVKGMVSIFTYGFEEARLAFEQARVKLVSLTDYPILLEQALHSNYITEKDVLSLNEWRKDPSNWNQKTPA